MNHIPFPLKQGDKSSSVSILHSVLEKLGYEIPAAEKNKELGEKTVGVIKQFQVDHGLKQTGEIDESTAFELNRLMADIEILNELQQHSFQLNKLDGIDTKLGQQSTSLNSINGSLTTHTEKLSDLKEDLSLQSANLNDIKTGLNDVGDPGKFQQLVWGCVRLKTRKPVAGCTVCAFHLPNPGDIKIKVDLGRTTSDNEGNYTIRYQTGKQATNLAVIAVNAQNKPLSEPVIKASAKPLEEKIDLEVSASDLPSEQNWIEGQVTWQDNGRPARDLVLSLNKIGFGIHKKKERHVHQATTKEDGRYALHYLEGKRGKSVLSSGHIQRRTAGKKTRSQSPRF